MDDKLSFRPPHTFKPGDVYNGQWQLALPGNLKSGTYTVSLKIPGMAYIKGANATIVVQ